MSRRLFTQSLHIYSSAVPQVLIYCSWVCSTASVWKNVNPKVKHKNDLIMQEVVDGGSIPHAAAVKQLDTT